MKVAGKTYEKHAEHHVHAAADGTEEHDLEWRDHPFASGL